MSGRRADGSNPRALGTNPRNAPDGEHVGKRLDRIDAKLDEVVRLLTAVHAQHRTGTHGPVTLDDGSVFLPGTGTVGKRTLSDDAQAALDALDAEDAHRD
jgi:hypothetical protein